MCSLSYSFILSVRAFISAQEAYDFYIRKPDK